MRYMLEDPTKMIPDQRRREVAAILARGVLRLRQCAQTSPVSGESRTPEKASKSFRDCLDEGAKRSPYVPAGYMAFESLAANLVPGDTNGAFDIFVHVPTIGKGCTPVGLSAKRRRAG